MTPRPKTTQMKVNDTLIKNIKINEEDYICLSDMAKSSGNERAIQSWLRTKNTIEFLGLWEQQHNPSFELNSFSDFKSEAGFNSFNPSVTDWVSNTGAIGILSKRGRTGGTYAHKDIAFEFGTWLSPTFKLLLITEFQRLKEQETDVNEWDTKRYLSKVNYQLHTDAIKEYIIPLLSKEAIHGYTYANEADLLNRLTFGQTSKEWKISNPELANGRRNQRDYASKEQLLILANLESLNSFLISKGISTHERIDLLGKEALRQYKALVSMQEINEDNQKMAPNEGKEITRTN